MVYVSEVSHRYDGRLFVFGGGFYPRGRIRAAVVARRPDAALDEHLLDALPRPAEAIDYYGELGGASRDDVHVGDTAVYAFRSQVFYSRAYVGVVAGLQGGSPSVLGLFDHLGNPLDRTTLLPLGPEEALDQVQRAAAAACPVVDSAVE